MTGRADRWIKWTTTGCVALLALIAGTVSYLHMHALVAMDGQPGWVAALTPLSVDGIIVAASTTLLAESRSGSRGGVLPWMLLAVGSVASLAANVAVAQPTITGRLIAAWPSFALICSYELLMRHVRRSAAVSIRLNAQSEASRRRKESPAGATSPATRAQLGGQRSVGWDLQRQAWRWAVANRADGGSLPSGKLIAAQYGRHERWGRLVKCTGAAGGFSEVEPSRAGVRRDAGRGSEYAHTLAALPEPSTMTSLIQGPRPGLPTIDSYMGHLQAASAAHGLPRAT